MITDLYIVYIDRLLMTRDFFSEIQPIISGMYSAFYRIQNVNCNVVLLN